MKATIRPFDLQMRHPFGISRGTTTVSHVFFVTMEGGGTGEGAPVRYHGETVEMAMPLVARMVEGVTPANLYDLDLHSRRAREIAPHCSSARCAFDLALHDRIGHELRAPVYRLLGYAAPKGLASSFTIGIDTDEKMVAKTHEASGYRNLKIKLGRDAATDIRTLGLIRKAAPDKILRVDANAGWSYDDAVKCIAAAADMGIEFIEQPLAIGNLEQLEKLHKNSPLPIIADEDCQDARSLTALLGKVDGINIKLMKCGGLWEARAMVAFARTVGWQVMFGCMIESGIGIAAATHLGSSGVCWDLDSEALISNNPVSPQVMDGTGLLSLSDAPGLGVTLSI
jgi:L-alanine-DL-glutamate epimerase-like enolase superfamily enzyme